MGVGEFGSGYSCALEIDENRMLLAFMGIFTFLVRLSVMLHRRSIMLIIHRSTHTPNTPHQPWHLIASQDAPSLVREILPNTMALAKLKYNSCIPNSAAKFTRSSAISGRRAFSHSSLSP